VPERKRVEYEGVANDMGEEAICCGKKNEKEPSDERDLFYCGEV
jgi:hypothetical protein